MLNPQWPKYPSSREKIMKHSVDVCLRPNTTSASMLPLFQKAPGLLAKKKSSLFSLLVYQNMLFFSGGYLGTHSDLWGFFCWVSRDSFWSLRVFFFWWVPRDAFWTLSFFVCLFVWGFCCWFFFFFLVVFSGGSLKKHSDLWGLKILSRFCMNFRKWVSWVTNSLIERTVHRRVSQLACHIPQPLCCLASSRANTRHACASSHCRHWKENSFSKFDVKPTEHFIARSLILSINLFLFCFEKACSLRSSFSCLGYFEY